MAPRSASSSCRLPADNDASITALTWLNGCALSSKSATGSPVRHRAAAHAQVVLSAGLLRVPLLARRAPPAFTLPAVIEFGPVLVGSTARTRRVFGNTGGGGVFSVDLAADEHCPVEPLAECTSEGVSAMTMRSCAVHAMRMHGFIQCGLVRTQWQNCLSAQCAFVLACLAWFPSAKPLALSAHILNAALQGSAECFSVDPAQLTVGADSVGALECAFAPLKAGAAACTLMLRCDSGLVLSHKLSGTGAPACMTGRLALCSIIFESKSLALHTKQWLLGPASLDGDKLLK